MSGTADITSSPQHRVDPTPSEPEPSAGTGARVVRVIRLLPRRTVIFLIELYRTWVSPMRLPSCRFEPTCSGYAVEALDRHGFVYGSVLSVIRLAKCGPWHKPGYDPVPERGFGELCRDLWSAVTGAHRPRNHQHASGETRAL
ncbi:membrane protein insertion efficiency factor YidD [Gordonia lacunae]|uniref:membrane protein insertion efficiency factor YidD n=1 Tax=Gordonia lacunae TaxID=417102 RepID=UPI0039E2852C